jgi:hypothetical protein
LLKVLARSGTVSDTVKKSSASQVQAANPSMKKRHCSPLRRAKAVMGLGTGLNGGMRVVNLRATYSATE